MTPELADPDAEAVETLLLSMGDDEFLVGHRLSYWVARGPTIEADNEVASIVQDELGHARLWYELAADDGQRVEDLAVGRPVDERRNSVLVEAHAGGFGETVVRQFCYDRAEDRLLDALEAGTHEELAARAEVARREERFHREHADVWLDRLSGTEEGRERLEAAFAECLPRSRDLFAFEASLEEALLDAGVLDRSFATLRAEWAEDVTAALDDLPLDVSDAPEDEPGRNGRLGEHTDELADLVENGFSEF